LSRFNLLKILNNLSISQKMLLIFIGCVILPLSIQNYFYYNDTEQNIQDEMMQRLTLSLSEKASRVNGSISGAINLANRYNTNEELYRLLDTNYTTDINFLITYQDHIEEAIFSDLAFNRQVRRMVIYTDNKTVLNGALINRLIPWDTINLGEELLDYHVVSLSPTENAPYLRISLIPVRAKNLYDRSLSIIKPMRHYPQYGFYNKIIRIDLDTAYLSAMLEDSDLFDNIFLADSQNRVIASANTFTEFGQYDIFQESDVKEGIVLLKQRLEDIPLTLYGLYDSKIISEEFSKTRWKTVAVASSSILFAIIFIFLIASNITRRTRLVVTQSKQVAQGNFIQIDETHMGMDEIGILAGSMNHVSAQLKTLIEEKYESQLLKARLEKETAQAKLLALQSQVNPHFMFNALECIRLKSTVKNETETAQMIKYMSRMFRHIITWEDDIIVLKEDMKFLDEFLKIQKYRFDDEFEFVVRVDKEAQECLLPKLVIQPLVENACVHGIEAISHQRYVEVSAEKHEDRLIITVSDNGSGIDEERLKALNKMLKDGKKIAGSVGLYNVHQRLVLYYGKEFTFEILSRQGRGTQIKVDIPVRYDKEEFNVLNSVS